MAVARASLLRKAAGGGGLGGLMGTRTLDVLQIIVLDGVHSHDELPAFR